MLVQNSPSPLSRGERLSLLVLLAVVGVGVWAGAIGCMVPPHQQHDITMDPPIAARLYGNLCQLRPGQSIGEVSMMMGDLGKPVARSVAGGQWMEAFQIEADREYERGLHRTEYLWLYFLDDNLVRWGPPFDWPDLKQVQTGN